MIEKRKSNKNIKIEKDSKKSYVYVYDGSELQGMLYWHYSKRKWVYDSLFPDKENEGAEQND